jgi:hypothetical protein
MTRIFGNMTPWELLWELWVIRDSLRHPFVVQDDSLITYFRYPRRHRSFVRCSDHQISRICRWFLPDGKFHRHDSRTSWCIGVHWIFERPRFFNSLILRRLQVPCSWKPGVGKLLGKLYCCIPNIILTLIGTRLTFSVKLAWLEPMKSFPVVCGRTTLETRVDEYCYDFIMSRCDARWRNHVPIHHAHSSQRNRKRAW